MFFMVVFARQFFGEPLLLLQHTLISWRILVMGECFAIVKASYDKPNINHAELEDSWAYASYMVT